MATRSHRQGPIRAVLAVMLLVLAAAPIFAANARAQDEVTITFWNTNQSAYADWIAQFEAEYPQINVETEYIGNYDDMAARMQTAVVGNTLPDVAQVGQRYGLPQLVDAGVVRPVTEYLTEEDIADIRDGLWSRFTYKGERWGVPFASSTPGMWFNKTMMEAAGLDPNNPPQTWDEVVTAAQAMTKDLDGDGQIDQWGFGTCADAPWYFRPMVLQNGGTLFDENNNPTINTPEAVEVMQWFSDAVHTYGITPPVGHQTAETDFKSGRYGLLFCSTSVRVTFQQEIGDAFEFGVTGLPYAEEPAAGVGGNALIATASGDEARQEAAATLIRWLTSTDMTVQMALTTGYVPVRESALERPEIVELLETDPFAATIYENLQYVRDSGIHPADALLWDGILSGIETVQTDSNASPQEVMDNLQTELTDYMAEYNA